MKKSPLAPLFQRGESHSASLFVASPFEKGGLRGIFLCLLLFQLLWIPSAWCDPIPRKILALYDATQFKDIYHTRLHRHAEMPLNYLGLEVVYRPINNPLPTEQELAEFRGILTWFQRPNVVAQPQAYCGWLSAQMNRGRKVVILGEPGIFSDQDRTMTPACLQMMRQLGTDYQGQFADNPYFLTLGNRDPSMVEFERKLDLIDKHNYSLYKPRTGQTKVYLHVKRTDLPDGDSSLIFTSPNGGFAHATYVLLQNSELDKTQWFLNPFRFFAEAYQVERLPRPDVTTVNGRRVFFSHIDGDGIFNVSYLDRESYSGEIIYEKILKHYPDLPITVSLITGYFDIPQYNGPKAVAMYRKIFLLPNVEPAAHGYAHPLIWKKGTLALTLPGYHYNLQKEVGGSVDLMNRMLQQTGIGKQTNLYQWTGDCLLTDEMIAAADERHLLDINGGDSRFDNQFHSYSTVMPLGILKGGHRQIYSGAPNENVYTNLWHGPFYGYGDVIDTFKNTEEPLRLKPIDIYYHFYSGERIDGLTVVLQAYQYALAQEIIPLTTSDYVRMADDFFQTKIFAHGDGYTITHEDTLRTIRFDHETRTPDFVRSRGIIGFRHLQGNLFIFLDEGKTHEIYLTSQPPQRPYLANASFLVKDFQATPQKISFAKRGWHKSEASLGGMAPNRSFQVTAGDIHFTAASDAHGLLKLTFAQSELGAFDTPVVIQSQ